MGCAGSTNSQQAAQPPPGKPRRRLSVDNVEATDEGLSGSDDEQEGERGLVKKMTGKTIIELAEEVGKEMAALNGDSAASGATPKRRISIGSETDTELNKRHSFKKKDQFKVGDNIDEESLGIGYTCRKGLKPESPNQDSWFVLLNEEDYAIYGVFDGHGARGHDVSNFVKENLPKLIITSQGFRESPESVIKDCFLKVQRMIENGNKKGTLNAQLSGTTCTVVVHDFVSNRLIVSHVGDSRAVLVRKDDSGAKIIAEDLTIDHKPELKGERQYIESHGGRVAFDGFANHRVYVKTGTYPGLNMSRALGDLVGSQHAGINNTPDVNVLQLRPKNNNDDDKSMKINADGTEMILLICSDGVWEFISSQQAKDIALNFSRARAKDCAECLAKEAWDRWIREEGGVVVDDITSVAIFL